MAGFYRFTLFFIVVLPLFFNVVVAVDIDGEDEDRAIYGQDTRRDVAQTSDFYRHLSSSVAVKIARQNILTEGIRYHFLNIDKKERFSLWPSAATCTGFLIASNKLVTAGHCMERDESSSQCAKFDWIFDFYYDNRFDYESNEFISFTKNQHYHCKKILSQKSEDGYDYAVIELDRDVVGRSALTLNLRHKDDHLQKNAPLFVIGSPSGLPLIYAAGKVSDTIAIKKSKGDYRVLTNLSTFQGNSGSPVFSPDGKVEGILVAGKADFDSKGHALVYSESTGEEVVYPIAQVPNIVLYIQDATLPVVNGGLYQTQVFEALELQHQEAFYHIKTICKKGSDLEVKNAKGWTPLLVAADKGFSKVVSHLLDLGAKTEVRTDRGSTALILASWSGDFNTVKSLLDHGAAVNAKTNNGSTALMKAVENGHLEIVDLLISYQANRFLKNDLGRDAAWYAESRGHEEILKHLQKEGKI